MFEPGPCCVCGKLTTRWARVDSEGKLSDDAPFRQVCQEHGPQWVLVAESVDGEWQTRDPIPLDKFLEQGGSMEDCRC